MRPNYPEYSDSWGMLQNNVTENTLTDDQVYKLARVFAHVLVGNGCRGEPFGLLRELADQAERTLLAIERYYDSQSKGDGGDGQHD